MTSLLDAQANVQATIPCNLCDNREVTVVSNRSRSGRPLRSVACKRCGLVWSDPRAHEALPYYTHDYRLDYKRTLTPQPKHVLRAGRVALDRLARIRHLLQRPLRILDVGSGGGEFAYLLQRLGHQVEGVEPNEGYAGYAASEYGLSIRQGLIGNVALPPDTYDLITLWHVLEHTEDPRAVLRQLRSALRPGGTLVVEVPNVEATCQSPRSSFHEAHVYTFGPATLSRLGQFEGLQPLRTAVSPDGGNITVTFQRAEAPPDAGLLQADLPGNHDRVTTILAAHTPLSHGLSIHPWRRAASRLGRALSERWQLRHGTSGRQLLDRLYAPQLNDARNSAPPPQRRPWVWLGGAYVLAVLAEETLVDHALPAAGFTPEAAIAVYLVLQVAVVAGLIRTLDIAPTSTKEFARIGGWSLPLFALPVFC